MEIVTNLIDTFKRGILEPFETALPSTPSKVSNKNLKLFGETNLYASKYTKLDSRIPAVAYVKLIIDNTGLFLTSVIPPKYIQDFTCERINNNVGKFTLNLTVPINTFEPITDELNVKLINLFGCVDAAATGTQNNIDGYACSLEYGWRGSSQNSVIKYNNAGIYGMTLNYIEGYYTYSISGLINNDPAETHAVSTKTILVSDLEDAIDITKSNNNVQEVISTASYDWSNVQVRIPKGSQRYSHRLSVDSRTKKARNIYPAVDGEYAESDYVIPATTWNDDYTFIKATTYWYSREDVEIIKASPGSNDINPKDESTYEQVSPYIDFTRVEAKQRLSDKIELLATYLYGKSYIIEVSHSDKEYDTAKDIADIATGLNGSSSVNDGESGTDPNAVLINAATTSWYTWLKHMVSLCQDINQTDAYSKYSKHYDINNDGSITKDELNTVSNTAFNAYNYNYVSDLWSKHGINIAATEKLSEDEFNKAYDKNSGVLSTIYNSVNSIYFNSFELLSYNDQFSDFERFSSSGQSSNFERLSYSDYSSDYDEYNQLAAYRDTYTEVSELIDDYNGRIRGSAQFYMHFMDATASKPAKLYIGPEKTDDAKYDYVVGNNSRYSTVKSFEMSENLVYLIAAAKTYISADNNGRYTIDPATAAIVPIALSTESDQIGANEDYAAKVANAILSDVSSGHISSTLTVISDVMSRSIQVTDPVRIKIKLNGGKSLFSGTYTVFGVEDTIDSSGVLTTTIKLNFTQSQALDVLKNIILSHLNSSERTSAST